MAHDQPNPLPSAARKLRRSSISESLRSFATADTVDGKEIFYTKEEILVALAACGESRVLPATHRGPGVVAPRYRPRSRPRPRPRPRPAARPSVPATSSPLSLPPMIARPDRPAEGRRGQGDGDGVPQGRAQEEEEGRSEGCGREDVAWRGSRRQRAEGLRLRDRVIRHRAMARWMSSGSGARSTPAPLGRQQRDPNGQRRGGDARRTVGSHMGARALLYMRRGVRNPPWRAPHPSRALACTYPRTRSLRTATRHCRAELPLLGHGSKPALRSVHAPGVCARSYARRSLTRTRAGRGRGRRSVPYLAHKN